ncbi:hypothetical protein SEVIR_2G072051v4 [Setaria viridis]
MLVMTDEQVYVVFLGHLPESGSLEYGGPSAVEAAHHDLLSQVLDDGSSASDKILHSYKRSLNGFAARLTEQEAQKLSSMEGIMSVFPSRTHELLTTRSWDFLGLPQIPPEAMPLEGEVIVGMLDSSVWPDSPPFSDEGFGPPPSRWKGSCQNFTCNNKITGARVYGIGPNNSTGLSLLDKGGHRSHTASIVAGRVVGEVSLGSLARRLQGVPQRGLSRRRHLGGVRQCHHWCGRDLLLHRQRGPLAVLRGRWCHRLLSRREARGAHLCHQQQLRARWRPRLQHCALDAVLRG